jgi:hypothetical protein
LSIGQFTAGACGYQIFRVERPDVRSDKPGRSGDEKLNSSR